jgi:hypothetical protein
MATMLEIEPQKLVGFAPDLDPSTPGIFQDCNNVIPTLIGFKGAASPVNAGLTALNEPVVGAALISRLNGTDRQFAGTASAMWENVSGTWVNQSRPGGYSLGTSSQWRFAAMGNESLAVNGTDVLQTALDGTFTNVPVALQSITVTNEGTGYTSAPTVAISAPDVITGVQATATATVSGSVSGATITAGGAGYAFPPNVTVISSSGSNAQVTTTISGSVTSVYVVPNQQGSGYTSAPTVTFTNGGGSGAAATAIIGTTATATATISGGAVSSVSLVSGPWTSSALMGVTAVTSGSGYTTVPTVTFSAPTSGTTATGTASVVLMPGGYYAVTGILITNAGSGYTSAPTVTISAPVAAGLLVGFQLTNAGSGYSSIPNVVLTGGGATTVAFAGCDICGVVNSVTVAEGGSGYTSVPTLTCSMPSINNGLLEAGSGFTSAPTITISGGGGTGATATCTIGAGGYINSVTITNAGSGFTSVPTVSLSPQPSASSATATLTAAISQTVTGITLTNAGSGYTANPTVTLSGGGVSTTNQATATAQIVQAPVGEIIFVANSQLFVCNCSNPSVVAGGNSWFASGEYDFTDWNYANEQSLSAYGELIDAPGPITAGIALNSNAVLFKETSMYLGTQTGYPDGWVFPAISKSVGALNQECVVSTGSTLYFIGPDDFYAYQGYGLPVPIGQSVRRWFFNTLNPTYKGSMSSFYDQDQRVIYWAFASNDSLDGTLDTCLTYNWQTGTWGQMSVPMQGFMQILNGQITYSSVGNLWPTYGNLPNISYNSSFWINFRTTPGYFDTTNTLQALAGVSSGATITTNAFGDDVYYSSMQQFFIRFKLEPTAGTAVWEGVTSLGSSNPANATYVNVADLVLSDSRIDVDQSSRWHQLELTFSGDFEAMEWVPTMVKRGRN